MTIFTFLYLVHVQNSLLIRYTLSSPTFQLVIPMVCIVSMGTCTLVRQARFAEWNTGSGKFIVIGAQKRWVEAADGIGFLFWVVFASFSLYKSYICYRQLGKIPIFTSTCFSTDWETLTYSSCFWWCSQFTKCLMLVFPFVCKQKTYTLVCKESLERSSTRNVTFFLVVTGILGRATPNIYCVFGGTIDALVAFHSIDTWHLAEMTFRTRFPVIFVQACFFGLETWWSTIYVYIYIYIYIIYLYRHQVLYL